MDGYLSKLRKAADLDTLAKIVQACHCCSLRNGCQHVVFGEGNPKAQVVICGEGPGADEDRIGRPFVGRAGQLLDQILAACGFQRSQHVFILNVVKCRPPGNRTPAPEEIQACLPNLRMQVHLLGPKIMILMGNCAAQTILRTDQGISQLRGQWVQKGEIWFMPTYHPAALFHRPQLKKAVWDDFQAVVAKYRALVDPEHRSPHC
ncbi:MAG: uracil-DNA glycosylase [Firmicutes bacterium]|nr:uracil-DNA glycosylase [Bacillota bacterium]